MAAMEKKDLLEKAKEMMAAPTCCGDAREALQKWIDAYGTDGEHAAAEAMIAELSEDVGTIDGYLGFLDGPGKEIFGEKQPALKEEARAAKKDGAKWCLCPACQTGGVILENKDIILG